MTTETTTHCSVDDCTDPVRARGYCTAHYSRFIRHGDPHRVAVVGRPPKTCEIDGCDQKVKKYGKCPAHHQESLATRVEVARVLDEVPPGHCHVEDCDRPHKMRGFCEGHALQLKRGKPLTKLRPRQMRQEQCLVSYCDRPVLARNFCVTHYERWRNGEDVEAPLREYKPRDVPCAVEVCDREVTSEGLCQTHYRRRLRGDENWDAPIVDKAPFGAGHLGKDGYRHVTIDGRRRFEHAVIMEELLGRPLTRAENVHHLNGQRADNSTNGPLRVVGHELRSGNLALWSKAQPAGQRVPDKMEFATELFRTYGGINGYPDVIRGLLALHGTVEERERYAAFLPGGEVSVLAAASPADTDG